MPERLVPSISLLSATVQNDRVTAARILVVEDSNAIRVPVATALSAQGFELASAPDGIELERLLPSFAPDLVILQRCAESLDLTDTERPLLGYLAAHRDRVVSKTQILTAVWGYDGLTRTWSKCTSPPCVASSRRVAARDLCTPYGAAATCSE
jgi:CheY-like chemotaxis protein